MIGEWHSTVPIVIHCRHGRQHRYRGEIHALPAFAACGSHAADPTSMRSVDHDESLAALVRDAEVMRRLERVAKRHLQRIALREPTLQAPEDLAADIVAAAVANMLGKARNANEVPTYKALVREVRGEVQRHRSRRKTDGQDVPRVVSLDLSPAAAHLSDQTPLTQLLAASSARRSKAVVARMKELAAAHPRVLELLELRLGGEGRVRDRRRLGMSLHEYRSTLDQLGACAAVAVAIEGLTDMGGDPDEDRG